MGLLAAEVERDWGAVLQQLRRAVGADPRSSEAHAALVALSRDQAYQAFETLLIRVERALGLPRRSGDAWHRQVLSDAAMPIPGLREVLVPMAAERDWDALRRFRHFLRHAYTTELDPFRLRSNVEHLENAVAASSPYIEGLIDSLRSGLGESD